MVQWVQHHHQQPTGRCVHPWEHQLCQTRTALHLPSNEVSQSQPIKTKMMMTVIKYCNNKNLMINKYTSSSTCYFLADYTSPNSTNGFQLILFCAVFLAAVHVLCLAVLSNKNAYMSELDVPSFCCTEGSS